MSELLAGRYRRIRSLGAGGMGEVWLAEDQELGRPVAIKRLRDTASALDPAMVDRMLREARVAARLRHPNIVVIFDVVRDENAQPVLIMDYVDGESLGDRLSRQGTIGLPEAARFGAQTASALAAAHRAGIVHRDVKPANILIDQEGQARLADFGIARGAGDIALTGTGQMLGTVSYMAPEIARTGVAAPASDVWSLGATLFAALEGRAPFADTADTNPAVLIYRVATQPAPAPQHAGELTDLINAMLAMDPAARPTAEDAAHHIGVVAAQFAARNAAAASPTTINQFGPASNAATPPPFGTPFAGLPATPMPGSLPSGPAAPVTSPPGQHTPPPSYLTPPSGPHTQPPAGQRAAPSGPHTAPPLPHTPPRAIAATAPGLPPSAHAPTVPPAAAPQAPPQVTPAQPTQQAAPSARPSSAADTRPPEAPPAFAAPAYPYAAPPLRPSGPQTPPPAQRQGAAAAWNTQPPLQPPPLGPQRRSRRTLLLITAIVIILAAGGVGTAIALSGGSDKHPTASTSTKTTQTTTSTSPSTPVITSSVTTSSTTSSTRTATLQPATFQCIARDCTFTAPSGAVPAGTSAVWNFGDGTTRTSNALVHHVFRAGGSYTVVLTSSRNPLTPLTAPVTVRIRKDARALLAHASVAGSYRFSVTVSATAACRTGGYTVQKHSGSWKPVKRGTVGGTALTITVPSTGTYRVTLPEVAVSGGYCAAATSNAVTVRGAVVTTTTQTTTPYTPPPTHSTTTTTTTKTLPPPLNN